ncbi:ketoisovalerate reductase [Astrocystis sublimbata]|nr:ketoisovalerate reductase [Astrocystis sublimbata]
MRIAKLSTRPVLALRYTFQHRFMDLCKPHSRLLHSSAQMQDARNPGNAPAEWLRRITEDGSKPPKLYAWKPEDLSVRREAEAKPAEASLEGPDTSNRESESCRRIYVLGVGNIGRLYAMCLSKIANGPPITLVVHRRELLEHWVAEPGIQLTRHGQVHRNAGFDIEWWTDAAPPGRNHMAEVATIGNLIVATKASDALPQVDRVRRYLDNKSTVAFVQNGMCKLWPPLGPSYVRARFPHGTSPTWIACVTTHGVTSKGPFRSIHASPANALVGPVMARSGADCREQTMYLMRQIASAPDLNAREVSKKELWVAQLEKIVVNAILNPLTAVLRCKNGVIFEVQDDDEMPTVIDKLLSEASETLSMLIRGPSSQDILLSHSSNQAEPPNHAVDESLEVIREQLLERFSFPRLRSMVYGVGAKVGANTSSMLQDMLAGKSTEIDDVNGWLLETAHLLNEGLRLPTHERLVSLVKSKVALNRAELCTILLTPY